MLTSDEIIWGYRYVLGHDPDQAAIDAHRGHADVATFRHILLESYEFRTLGIGPFSKHHWVLAAGPSAGDYIWADVADRMVGYDVIHGVFEPLITSVFSVLAAEADTIVDVGANIGWYTLLGARIAGKTGQVIAFEPNPTITEHLMSSIEFNKYQDRVIVRQEALAERSGTATLARPKRVANWGNAFIMESADPNTHECINVPLIRLDDLELQRIDLMKIDCEGAEPLVLAGGTKTIERCRPVIISEVFDQQLRLVSNMTASLYIGRMFAMGHSAFAVEQRALVDSIPTWVALNVEHLTNIVFVPNEKMSMIRSKISRFIDD